MSGWLFLVREMMRSILRGPARNDTSQEPEAWYLRPDIRMVKVGHSCRKVFYPVTQSGALDSLDRRQSRQLPSLREPGGRKILPGCEECTTAPRRVVVGSSPVSYYLGRPNRAQSPTKRLICLTLAPWYPVIEPNGLRSSHERALPGAKLCCKKVSPQAKLFKKLPTHGALAACGARAHASVWLRALSSFVTAPSHDGFFHGNYARS